jgi:hypothetical protein
MSFRGHVAWIVAVGVLSAAVLPVLVFHTGVATLGPYAGGGLRDFLANYVADLARLRADAWTLLLGPVVLVAAWRLVVATAWPRRAADRSSNPPAERPAPPAARRDPTIGRLSRE